MTQECSLLFNLLEQLEKDRHKFFFVCLFLLLSCRNSLYIVDTNMCGANIFSNSFLFTLSLFFFGCIRSQVWHTGSSLWHMGSFVAVHGLVLVVACGLQSAWAQMPCSMWDLSSLTRDQTCVLCIGRWILNHWTTREVPLFTLLIVTFNTQVLNFDLVQLIYFFFCLPVLLVSYPIKYCQIYCHETFPLCFLVRVLWFQVLSLGLLFHFELIFVYGFW